MPKSFNSRALMYAYGQLNPVQKQTYNKLLKKKGYNPDKAMRRLGVKPFRLPRIPATTSRMALRLTHSKTKKRRG